MSSRTHLLMCSVGMGVLLLGLREVRRELQAAGTAANQLLCFDKDPDCPGFASRGDCTSNQGWMGPNCANSCGVCKSAVGCLDTDEQCAAWAARGDCLTNTWMATGCPRSCDVATGGSCSQAEQPCIDLLPACADLAAAGQCRPAESEPLPSGRSADWMGRHCGWSCYTCWGVAATAPAQHLVPPLSAAASVGDQPAAVARPQPQPQQPNADCVDTDPSCKGPLCNRKLLWYLDQQWAAGTARCDHIIALLCGRLVGSRRMRDQRGVHARDMHAQL